MYLRLVVCFALATAPIPIGAGSSIALGYYFAEFCYPIVYFVSTSTLHLVVRGTSPVVPFLQAAPATAAAAAARGARWRLDLQVGGPRVQRPCRLRGGEHVVCVSNHVELPVQGGR